MEKRDLSSDLLRQGIVAALLVVFIAMALGAMFTTSRVVTELEWIGMTVVPLPPEAAMAHGIPTKRGGLLVEDAEGIAARAGVRPGDVLLSINGALVGDLAEFSRVTRKTNLLDGVILDLVHGGARRTLAVSPGRTPARAIQPTGVMGRKWLGVEAENFTAGERRELGIPPGIQGVLIDGVAANSRAERAGLLPNDVIVSVNDQGIDTTADLWRMLNSLSVTAPLGFRLYRDGKFISLLLHGQPGPRGRR